MDIRKSCGWPECRELIRRESGEDEAAAFWADADRLYRQYIHLARGKKGVGRAHTMGAAAIGAAYLALKPRIGSARAVTALTEAMRPASIRKHDRLERMPARLFMRAANIVTRVMFSEKAGFQRRWVSDTDTDRRYDLLTCPYVDAFSAMGCPEVCPAVCAQDDFAYQDMKNGVCFPRKKTLGRGDDRCDFGFTISKSK